MSPYDLYNNQQHQSNGTPLMITLLPDISMADSYNLAPNSSAFYLDQSMTTLKMRSRDQSGFLRPDRVWELKEITPPVTDGSYVTKKEFDELSSKMDKLLSAWQEFSK